MKTQEIKIRDPFIYAENGAYYMYGTTDADPWRGEGAGFTVFRGTDLENWESLGNAFDKPETYWGEKNFWAPEMHAYNGKYYLFASFKAQGKCRATAVLKADSPAGPFRPWGAQALTPRDWECLDGTLYVEDGQPYLVFCHEWVQVGDGEICALPLKKDLSGPDGEARRLFCASEAPWVVKIEHSSGKPGYVTDGPFFYRAKNGALYLLWSSFCAKGYAIGLAQSDNGRISGAWKQREAPLFEKDGGHGMLFRARGGQLTLSIHAPNHTPDERALFLPIEETDEGLSRKI